MEKLSRAHTPWGDRFKYKLLEKALGCKRRKNSLRRGETSRNEFRDKAQEERHGAQSLARVWRVKRDKNEDHIELEKAGGVTF